MTIFRLFILIFVTFSVIGTAQAKETNIDIFIDGCHLDDPVPGPTEWYGIYISNANDKKLSHLLKVDITSEKKFAHVDDLYDYCVKSRPEENAEAMASSAVILLRGDYLKTGALKSARLSSLDFKELENHTYVAGERLPKTDERIAITLGSKNYTLQQTTELDDNVIGNNHTLTLRSDNIVQVLFDKRGNYEGGTDFYIIWAGDIDGDEKLDLVVNLSEHYASPYHLRLFLSSKANEGELLKQVAERGFSAP